jgi:hypothetical protein
MANIKIRYICGHEVDFDGGADGHGTPSTLREQRLAKEHLKCPGCRHDTVKLQLVSAKRVRNWR